MKPHISLLAFAFLTVSCLTDPAADLILINGNIYTVSESSPKLEAVAIRDGMIVEVGANEEILKTKSSLSKVIDLEGKTVIPGIIEGHGHFMSMGYNKMQVDLHDAGSFEELIHRLREKAGMTPRGEWIIGRGWHQDKWKHIPGKVVDVYPTHTLLSAVTPENPVLLYHASGHASFANARAMEIAGINKETKFDGEGEIIRDGQHDPTGIFIESATGLIARHVPGHSRDEMKKALALATEECLKYGITGFHDAGAGLETIGFYRAMLDSGHHMPRLYVMISGSDPEVMDYYLARGPETGYHDDFLNIRSIKLFADGALGSRGAWLLEPYADFPAHSGEPALDSAFIYETCIAALRSGFQVCTHAIGDRANREVLNIYEKSFAEFPDISDTRFRIEHAQHLSGTDISRFGSLGVIASMQAIHMSSDRPWAIDRLGEARIKEGAYVWQKLLLSGARIVNGTDVPVEPANTFANFYAAVTRKALNGSPAGGYEPDQKMTREQALRSCTIDAAFGEFAENKKGSIEPGKYADLTVLSKDIMSIPEEEILSTEVVMTILDGEIVFEKQ
ncbi:MAG TPA: amidohydrolase family protein [Cyclobacteriaceae bacterium]|nr:amidohydrolase family protein [Cyclobacteriaceae bacterium]